MTDPTIIIDNGSGICKAGFAGEEAPRSFFSSIIGKPKRSGNEYKNHYAGDDAYARANVLNIMYPIERGIIKDWDAMETLWHHTFYDVLKVDPSEQAVLHTESVLNSKANREKMIYIMFEVFNVPSFCVFNHAVLALHLSGLKSGTVVDVG